MGKITPLIPLFIFLSFQCFSQIIFEDGYFIDESNQKVQCLIKNKDWKNNPFEFEYKLNEDAAVQNAGIENVTEFGIDGVSKFIRAKVNLDKSSNNLENLSSERDPIFQEEVLFLKVLIEGKASIYSYQNGNLVRFYYKINDSELIPLVYKQYLLNNNIATNNSFRQQLFVDLKCESIKLQQVSALDYNKEDLKRIFIRYNECTSSEYLEYGLIQNKKWFNLSLRPGLNISTLTIRNNTSSSKRNIDFGSKCSWRFGVESEFILPYNKNKWGIIIEPTFQYFKAEESIETQLSGFNLKSTVDYQSIELPVGLRHYFYLNDNSKVFMNISYIFDFNRNSSIKFSRRDGSIQESLDIKTGRSIGLGIGYKLNDKYSFEMRYLTNRNILHDYRNWISQYRTFSVLLGFTL